MEATSQTQQTPQNREARTTLGTQPLALVRSSLLGLRLRSELPWPQTGKIWGFRCPRGKGFLNSRRSDNNALEALKWPRRCVDQRKPTDLARGTFCRTLGLVPGTGQVLDRHQRQCSMVPLAWSTPSGPSRQRCSPHPPVLLPLFNRCSRARPGSGYCSRGGLQHPTGSVRVDRPRPATHRRAPGHRATYVFLGTAFH